MLTALQELRRIIHENNNCRKEFIVNCINDLIEKEENQIIESFVAGAEKGVSNVVYDAINYYTSNFVNNYVCIRCGGKIVQYNQGNNICKKCSTLYDRNQILENISDIVDKHKQSFYCNNDANGGSRCTEYCGLCTLR